MPLYAEISWLMGLLQIMTYCILFKLCSGELTGRSPLSVGLDRVGHFAFLEVASMNSLKPLCENSDDFQHPSIWCIGYIFIPKLNKSLASLCDINRHYLLTTSLPNNGLPLLLTPNINITWLLSPVTQRDAGGPHGHLGMGSDLGSKVRPSNDGLPCCL